MSKEVQRTSWYHLTVYVPMKQSEEKAINKKITTVKQFKRNPQMPGPSHPIHETSRGQTPQTPAMPCSHMSCFPCIHDMIYNDDDDAMQRA